MAYIPEKHNGYDLLPQCQKYGGEVFSYPCSLLDQLEQNLPKGHSMMPYGYSSYEEYYTEMDKIADVFFQDSRLSAMYQQFLEKMRRMNVKESWSVLRYVGKTNERLFGLTNGKCYYWPCSFDKPVYEGVIDDEEFTSYLYPTEACDWDILDDPTGMAYRTIYGKQGGYISREQYGRVMNQLTKNE